MGFCSPGFCIEVRRALLMKSPAGFLTSVCRFSAVSLILAHQRFLPPPDQRGFSCFPWSQVLLSFLSPHAFFQSCPMLTSQGHMTEGQGGAVSCGFPVNTTELHCVQQATGSWWQCTARLKKVAGAAIFYRCSNLIKEKVGSCSGQFIVYFCSPMCTCVALNHRYSL